MNELIVVLLESGVEARAFRLESLNGARTLAAQLAASLGAAAPTCSGQASVGPGGRISYWIADHDRADAVLLIRREQGPEISFYHDPIMALRTGLRSNRDYALLELESPTAIDEVRAPRPGRTFDAGPEGPAYAQRLADLILDDPAPNGRDRLRLVTPRVGRAFSREICPRCQDHPLHEDPVFDEHGRDDGLRICSACGQLEAMRREGLLGPFD